MLFGGGIALPPPLLQRAEFSFPNGHVPVTGILSAIAVLAAVLDERDAVVMPQRVSASAPTFEHNGRPVNHRYSKRKEFRALSARSWRSVGVAARVFLLTDGPDRTVGRQAFAALEPYHGSFHK